MTMDRGRPGRAARWLAWLIACDVVLSAGYIGTSRLVVPAGTSGQAIAVLWGDENEIGPETERRIEHAVALWKRGDGKQLLFCIGGARPMRGFFGAQVVAERLAAAGITPEQIRTGPGSNDTISNLSEIADVASKAGVQEVVVIAAPLQAMRARLFLPKPPGDLVINWSPYDLWNARPPVGILELVWQVHSEWLKVAASLLLSDEIRSNLVGSFRK